MDCKLQKGIFQQVVLYRNCKVIMVFFLISNLFFFINRF
jgi:hypothetical protein